MFSVTISNNKFSYAKSITDKDGVSQIISTRCLGDRIVK